MKEQLQELLIQSLSALLADGVISELPTQVRLNHTKDKAHGDYATNVALMLAKQAKCAPKVLAEQIIAKLSNSPLIRKTEIAGPGFINFFLSDASSSAIVTEILTSADDYGLSDVGMGKRVLLEFVSANPTGPLHVGHGRGAAYGATIANLMRAVGFEVDNEYYVNDAGRQMDILTVSIFLRYLSIFGEELRFPDNGYQGDYIQDIAKSVVAEYGERWRKSAAGLFEDICKDEAEGGDKEAHIDALVARSKQLLGEGYQAVFRVGIDSILGGIKSDLAEFGVDYQQWFSEQSLIDSGLAKGTTDTLQKNWPHLRKRRRFVV